MTHQLFYKPLFFRCNNVLELIYGRAICLLLWLAFMLPVSGQVFPFAEVNFAPADIVTEGLVYPLQTQLADIDGDGHKDIITFPAISQNLIWYKNNGEGTFNNSGNQIKIHKYQDILMLSDYYNYDSPYNIVPLNIGFLPSDLNNDGLIDLLIYGRSYNTSFMNVEIHLNQGNGYFEYQQTLTTVEAPELADLNGNGFKDIFYARNDRIVWRANNGNGSFGDEQTAVATPPYTPGFGVLFPFITQSADLNLDGNADILLWDNEQMYWLPNLGGGVFAEELLLLSANSISRPVVFYYSDMDADGIPDLLLCNYQTAVWHKNFSGGAMSSAITIIPAVNYHYYNIAPADLNNDTHTDIAAVQYFFGLPYQLPQIYHVLNDGNGNFESPQTITYPATVYVYENFIFSSSLCVDDLNNDNLPDFVFSSTRHFDISLYQGIGTGSVSPPVAVGSGILGDNPNYMFSSFQIADLDNDNFKDVVIASTEKELLIYKNLGQKNFKFIEQLVLPEPETQLKGFEIKDINADGNPDLLLICNADTVGKVHWYENNGNGTFANLHTLLDNLIEIHLWYLADADNDGDDDLFFIFTDNTAVWYENTGGYAFTTEHFIDNNIFARELVVGEIDGDALPDFVYLTTQATATIADDSIVVRRNTISGSFEPLVSLSGNLTNTWSGANMMLNDLNNDGVFEITYNTKSDWAKMITAITYHPSGNFSVVGIANAESWSDSFKDPYVIADFSLNGSKEIWSTHNWSGVGSIGHIVYLHYIYGVFPSPFSSLSFDWVTSAPFSPTFIQSLAADIDNDGDMDVLSIASISDQLTADLPGMFIFENLLELPPVEPALPQAAFSTLPMPTAADTVAVCQGQTIAFTNSSQHADNYVWLFGNGDQSSLPSPDYAFQQPGTYTVRLIAGQNSGGNSPNGFPTDTATITVVVHSGALPEISCTGSLCAGTVLTYTASAQSPCLNYEWQVSGAQSFNGQGTPSIEVNWGNNPVGGIQLTLADCEQEQCTLPATAQIGIIPPQLFISGDTIPCQGEPVLYSLPSFNGAAYHWIINPPGAATSVSGQNTSALTVTWGAQNATLQVQVTHQLAGCSVSDVSNIVIPPPLLIITNQPVVCQGETTTFSNNTGFPVVWSVSGGVITGGQNTSIVHVLWDMPGTFTVTAQSLNPLQHCQPETAVSVTVKPAIVQPSISGAAYICPAQIYAYQIVSPDPVTSEHSFTWTVQGGSIIGGSNLPEVKVQWLPDAPVYSISVVQRYKDLYQCHSPIAVFTPFLMTGNEISLTGNTTVCTGTTGAYAVSLPATNLPVSWSLSPPNAGILHLSPGNNLTVSVSWTSTEQEAVLTATYCGIETALTIHLLPAPEQPVLSVNQPLCEFGSSVISANPGFEAYLWSDDTGENIANTPNITINTSGVYRVRVTDANGCTAANLISVQQKAAPVAHIYTSDYTDFCIQFSPQSSQLTALKAPNTIFQWSLDDLPVAGANEPDHIYTSDTAVQSYIYRVEITDTVTGCRQISNPITINHYDCTIISVPGLPSPSACVFPDDAQTDFALSYNNQLCNTLNADNLSEGDAVQYLWNWGENTGFQSAPAGMPVEHTYNMPGEYRVTLSAKFINLAASPEFCYKNAYQTAIVPLKAVFDAPNKVCVGDTVTFTDASVYIPDAEISLWIWDFGDGTPAVSGLPNPQHVYDTPGVYTVSLTAGNSDCTDTYYRQIQVLPLPAATFTALENVCLLQPVQFAALPVNASAYHWDFGDGNGSNVPNPLYAYSQAGTFSVSLAITNSTGCNSLPFAQTLTVNDSPVIPQTIAASKLWLCPGDSVLLTAPPDAVSYLWNNGSAEQNIWITQPGAYTVHVLPSDGTCAYTAEPVYIQAAVPPPLSFNPNLYEIHRCGNQPFSLGDSYFLGHSYIWSSGYTGPYLTVANSGNYSVTVTNNTTGCSSQSGPVNVYFHDFPPAPEIQPADAVICAGEILTLQVVSPQAEQYLWNTNTASSTVDIFMEGTYSVTITDINGCTSSANTSMGVNPLPPAHTLPRGCYDFCLGDSILLNIPPNTAVTWLLNGNPVSESAHFKPQLSGNYVLTLQNEQGCSAVSDTLTLQIIEGCTSPPLPVSLIGFTGEAIEEGNLLQWTAATETNCHFYTLYATHQNRTGASFKPVTVVPAAGFSSIARNYNWLHPTQEPFSCYRLTQTDFDGQENYLAAVTLQRNAATVAEPLLHFTPNPADRQVKVELYHLMPDTPANAHAVLLTSAGSRVWEQTVSLPEFTIDRADLPGGLYFLHLHHPNSKQLFAVGKVVFW
ncbi:MAG: VCBS repeat-containing protein [Sphingobacteriales bacterium]|nr:MAG: VCBS repeat-containing protein [Sphingobacteriales bacterium]